MRFLAAAAIALTGCSNSTSPKAQVAGDWLGSGVNQLAITITQVGPYLTASGQIARIGLISGGPSGGAYLLHTGGHGQINSDSTVVMTFAGRAGTQVFRARLYPGDTISGVLTGDRIDGDQYTTLRRYSLHD